MNLTLPDAIGKVIAPLWVALPLEQAMAALVVQRPNGGDAYALAVRLMREPVIARQPDLAAGLWLYVDDLDASHRISQQHEADATFNYWHAIMHRREGDFSNSHYWFRRVGSHPAFAAAGQDYDGHRLVDEVEAAYRQRQAPETLIAKQRREWAALFEWCAAGHDCYTRCPPPPPA